MNFLESRRYSFPAVWIGGDLEDYRICDSTYNLYDIGSLPPLPGDELNGSFDWLIRHPSPLDFDERFRDGWGITDGWNNYTRDSKAELMAACQESNVHIPPEFFRFMDNIDLVTRIRSPTDCEFVYPRAIIPYPSSHAGHFVHFYSDSQDCWLWYLYIDPEQNCVVIAADDFLDEPHDDEYWYNEHGHMNLCASSFESFMFRLWIENEIWFRLVQNDLPLTHQMIEYLRFYGAEI